MGFYPTATRRKEVRFWRIRFQGAGLVLLCHKFIPFLHVHTKGNGVGKSPKDAFDAISS